MRNGKTAAFKVALAWLCALSALTSLGQIVTIQEPAARLWGAIDFINPNQGIVGGARSAYAVTLDGGATWRVDSLGTGRNIVKVKMLSADTIIAIAENVIAVSADTGRTWTFTPIPFPSAGQEAFLVDGKQIWLSSKNYSGTLYHTRNRGLAWDSLRVHPSSRTSFYGLHANASGLVVAAGGNFEANRRSNAIYRSVDNGITWDSIAFDRTGTLSDFNQFFDLSFGTDDVGYAVGAKNIVYKTTDGGLTWLLLTPSDNSQPYLRSAFARGTDTVFAFGDPGYARSGMFSKNGGSFFAFLPSQWSDNLPSSANKRITAIWYGNGVGYAATGSGRVLKFTAQSLGWVVANDKLTDNTPVALYPNPSSPASVVRLEGILRNTRVEVLDALGRVVSEENLKPGDGFRAPDTAGMYMLRIWHERAAVYRRLLVR